MEKETGKEQNNERESIRALVSGRVQGVGFRYFVLQQAQRLGLTGTARNLADGRVEVQAQGNRKNLETLVEALRQGPRLSRVEDVKVEWGIDIPPINKFEAR